MSDVQVQLANANDIDAVCELLHTKMNPRIARSR